MRKWWNLPKSNLKSHSFTRTNISTFRMNCKYWFPKYFMNFIKNNNKKRKKKKTNKIKIKLNKNKNKNNDVKINNKQ